MTVQCPECWLEVATVPTLAGAVLAAHDETPGVPCRASGQKVTE